MTNFEKAVEVVGIEGIVAMMESYCYEATGSDCDDCPWRKAIKAIPGCHCIDAHDIITFLERQA